MNDCEKGAIYFDRMYEVLHETDENGVPVCAKINMGSSNTQGNGKKMKNISVGQVRVTNLTHLTNLTD